MATANPDEYQITDNRDGPNDGSDIVSGFEQFQFSDGTLALADILNTAPDADADGPYGVDEDALLSVSAADGVLSGDSDLEGNALTAELVSGPSNALTFTLKADGSFSYQGVADFNGLDSSSYARSTASHTPMRLGADQRRGHQRCADRGERDCRSERHGRQRLCLHRAGRRLCRCGCGRQPGADGDAP